ncbi:hypothetical protein D0862_06624 [Hortaea werneckii]|uniref:DUF7918 domain-containing protein n=1 Tax=Hortaea werneckii TaxID=91943 RepID=A0A3M7GID0_HORWE|nr:hypothetical protein D0862_06624 [Hortaea werneckii]
MAIHPEVPGLAVGIDVAGQDLTEYDDEDAQEDSPGVITKHIEAVSGAQFRISVRFDVKKFQYADQPIVVSMAADGEFTSRRCFTTSNMASNQRYLTGSWVGTGRNGQRIKRDLIFSDLIINEGQVNSSLFGKLNDLGTIVLQWRKGKLSLRESLTEKPGSRKEPLIEGQLPEKNLKGQSVTHHTTYGPERQHPRDIYKIETIGKPFATFKFKYRSRGALQSLGLLPRSPSPIPLEDRNIEDLSLQEAQELLRRQQGRFASNETSVKREMKREHIGAGDDSDDGGDVEIVDLPEKRRRLNANGAGTDVVDLCGDD